MAHYRCDCCLAHFQTNDPERAACPCCGEWVRERTVTTTDRPDAPFTIGGNVTEIPPSESRVSA